jgi:hypothetical protein
MFTNWCNNVLKDWFPDDNIHAYGVLNVEWINVLLQNCHVDFHRRPEAIAVLTGEVVNGPYEH